MNSDSHVKTYTEISPLEALKLLVSNDGNPISVALRGTDQKWQERSLAGVSLTGINHFEDSDTEWWPFCARVTLAPKIADGHNPDKLTVDQVGVKEGRRTISADEQLALSKNSGLAVGDLEYWSGSRWMTGGWGGSLTVSYRTKQPAGFYLPSKPPALKPWDFSSAPRGLIAIAHKGNREAFFYVCGMGPKGITGPRLTYDWQDLADNYEHSTDFVNWKPCGTA